MYDYLAGSLLILLVWIILFITLRKHPISKKEMIRISLFTAPLGLLELLFVPEYWNPPTLFNLARTIGFDIESIIFAFAAGGIAAVLYEGLFEIKHVKMRRKDGKHASLHRLHMLALFSPLIFLIFFEATLGWNPIYTVSLAMFLGALAAAACRPDLKKKIFYGGAIFLGLYFVFFILFNLLFPGYVQEVWNFSQISGILILGIPIEELLFAFSFGLLWSGLYEHVFWYKVVKK